MAMFAIFSLKAVPQPDVDMSYEVISKFSDSTPNDEGSDAEIQDVTVLSQPDMSSIQMPDGGSSDHLHCIATSLEAPLVERLTNHVRRKLGISGPQALTGTADTLDGGDSSGGPAVLFCVQGDFLVCLLDNSVQKLDAFHDQLCEFIRHQAPILADPQAAAAAFAAWEDATVAALQRTVKLLRNVMPPLLTLISVGCGLTVDCQETERRREIESFIGQCRLMEVGGEGADAAAASGDGRGGAASPFPRGAVLCVSGRSVSLDFSQYTEFAKLWSSALLDSVDDENPVRLQQRILDLKLRASRDVNAAKRLLAEAVGDYYALYRLVQALRHTGNAVVLLHNLSSLSHPDEREAIACVQTFLAGSCHLLSTATASAVSIE